MLIRFTAANHRSIKEPVELSFVAVDGDRSEVRHFERLNEGILTLAAIYGPNASGKSNILDAITWVAFAVRNSLRAWDDCIPREPFRFAGSSEEPSIYSVDFLVDGTRHTYTLQLTERGVEFEELVSYPEKRVRTLFTREGGGVNFRRGLQGVSGLKELLTPTTLVLTLARRFEVPDLIGAAQFLGNITTPFVRRRRVNYIGPTRYSSWGMSSTSKLFIDAYRPSMSGEQAELFPSADADDLELARHLLRFADLGIEDVEIVEVNEPATTMGRPRFDLRLVHRAGNEKESFELSEESDGTQMWFRLIGPALAALTRGYPLVLDEIDASLHPLLSSQLLELFRTPQINKRNAQLIFSSHDTTLLGDLNRDEVWFTEKGEDGATRLTALAEFGSDKVRRSLNLERAYLQGRFGALPNLRDSYLLKILEGTRDRRESEWERSLEPRKLRDDAT